MISKPILKRAHTVRLIAKFSQTNDWVRQTNKIAQECMILVDMYQMFVDSRRCPQFPTRMRRTPEDNEQESEKLPVLHVVV
eukprot:4350659-Amphidinium_carterae.1